MPSCYPAPPEWKALGVKVKVTALVTFFSAMAALTAVAAVAAFQEGSIGEAVQFLAGFFIFTHFVGLSVTFNSSSYGQQSAIAGPCPVHPHHQGIMFRYRLWPYYWLSAIMFISAGLLALLTFEVMRAIAPSSDGVLVQVLIGSLITGAVIAFLTTVLYPMLRNAPGAITLCPDGVNHRHLYSSRFTPWHAIFAVTALWRSSPLIIIHIRQSKDPHRRGILRRFLLSVRSERRHWMLIACGWLANPAILYHSLRFYHTHPAESSELASLVIPQRISAGGTVMTDEAYADARFENEISLYA